MCMECQWSVLQHTFCHCTSLQHLKHWCLTLKASSCVTLARSSTRLHTDVRACVTCAKGLCSQRLYPSGNMASHVKTDRADGHCCSEVHVLLSISPERWAYMLGSGILFHILEQNSLEHLLRPQQENFLNIAMDFIFTLLNNSHLPEVFVLRKLQWTWFVSTLGFTHVIEVDFRMLLMCCVC